MPTIFLIRHGENDTMAKRLAGRLPGVHLNEKGRLQALKIAAALAGKPIKAIYSSPLERTMQTAEPLAKLKGLDVQVNEGLNELDYGSWQGMRYMALKRKALWRYMQQEPSQVLFPGGESFREALLRVVMALDDISNSHGKKDLVVCFTHADVIRLTVAYYLGMDMDHFQRLQVGVATITEMHLHAGNAVFGPIGQRLDLGY